MDDTIIINEVVSSNSHSLTDPTLGSPDWIELYNTTSEEINLAGYKLTNKSESKKGVFPDVTIPAGGYLTVFAAKGITPANSSVCCIDFGVSKGGEKLYLLNPDSIVINHIDIPALLTDESYSRREDGTYGFCTSPTPGKKNDSSDILDQEKLQAALKAGKLIINEVMPKSADGSAWVELYNSGDSDINLANYSITDDQKEPLKWHMPRRILGAGNYAVVNLGQQGEGRSDMNAPFKLGSHDTSICLFDVEGKPVSEMTWPQEIPPGMSVVSGNLYSITPTKGAANSKDTFTSITPCPMDSSDPVRISEVLPKNKYSIMDSDDERTEWIELYNSGAQPVSLAGYYLSDNKNKLLKWAFPDQMIEAKSYLVVFLSGKQGKTGELHASFRLAEGETEIYLSKSNGMRFDSLALPAAIVDNSSVGRDSSDNVQYYAHPTPGSANAKGVAAPELIGCFDKTGVFISEVCAANIAKSGINDWVELHNGSAGTVDLKGYYLSDDANKPKKWLIPSLSIKANGYAVIETSSDPAKRNANTAAFGISPKGETLLLSDAEGTVIDVFDTGALSAGVTSGRIEDDNTKARVYFTVPTRGKPNTAQHLAEYTAMPVFSEAGLYHTTAFSLGISCTMPQAKIYYTTDGSIPTKASTLYTKPIPVSRNTPIRAISYADGYLPSVVNTATFLFDKPYTVPVVSITGNPKEMNILIKTDRMHYKPEYPAHIDYYNIDGNLGVSFPSGLRPKGNLSLTFPQNSLTIALRNGYGQSSVTYSFFPDSDVTTYSALTLRSSGEDYNASRMRDSYFHKVAKGLDVDSIETRIVVAYMNGVYCGVYDLTEDQDADFLASHNGLDSSNIDLINHDNTALSGDTMEFLRVSKIARTWNTKDDKVFAEFAKLVDVEACTDYLVARCYFGDGDIINSRYWRARDYSVKWRPLLFDLDFSLLHNDANRNVFYKYFTLTPIGENYPTTDLSIFIALRKNQAWCNKFIERYIQLAETQFKPDRMLGIFDDMKSVLEPEMARHIAKWHAPGSMNVWQSETGKLRSAIEKRQAIALKQLQKYFRVSDARMQEYIKKYSARS